MDKFWKFVEENITASPSALRLKYHGKSLDGIDIDLAITQIECRQKFSKKLAFTLAKFPRFLFPSLLAGEQSTSDLLASYHAGKVKPGAKIVDLTAGLGIDALHLAARGAKVDAIELDPQRAEALKKNMAKAGIIAVHNANCIEYLKDYCGDAYDIAFIDPARRDLSGGRVFALTDCLPNVIEMMPLLREKAKEVWIKASPMLDITRTLADLPHACTISALGTPTECKELYITINFESSATPIIEAVTLHSDNKSECFSFTQQQENEAATQCIYATPEVGQYLYEPSPCIMKAAPFDLLSLRFNCRQPHPNTHLFFSESLIKEFPGTTHKVVGLLTYESKHIKRFRREYPKISVTTRNFPISADALRAKLGVKDGGDLRLFGITALSDAKLLVIAKPIHNY